MTTSSPRIASLFTGTGALDMAAQAVFGGEMAWHCQYDPEDKHQFAAHLLAYRWPGVPNIGDITQVDWKRVLDEYGPVDILTGGFPCTDLSLAGKRAGLNEDTRSGLWIHMARAIDELRPELVVIENVRGLLSAPAHSDVEPCPWCLGDTDSEPPLRALGTVLADLAELGFDAEWVGLPASSIGAPHERWREFLLALPADAPRTGLEGLRPEPAGRGPERGDQAAADADHVGGHRAGACGGRRPEPAHHDQPAADTSGFGRGEGGAEPARVGGGSDAAAGGGPATADTDVCGRRHEPGIVGGERPEEHLQGDSHAVTWGQFEPAIRHWEDVLGRPAPRPVDDRGRLAPELPEWMMGLPAGHITAVPPVPGMTASQLRNAQLKAAGNGVVPQQAQAALRLLLARIATGATGSRPPACDGLTDTTIQQLATQALQQVLTDPGETPTTTP